MLKSSLLVACRKLYRDKAYVVINVLGLSLGIVACLAIWLVAHHEFTFDTFHPDADRIYRLITYEKYTDDSPKQLVPAVVPPLPGMLASRTPGIDVWASYHILPEIKVSVTQHDDRKDFLNSTTIIANENYFKILQYSWEAGSPEEALSKPNTVVLTAEKARLYFGETDFAQLIGRTLVYDDSIQVSISGIINEWRKNTDFPGSDFISEATVNHGYLREVLQLDAWKGTPPTSRALVKLNVHTNATAVQAALNAIFNENWRSQLMLSAALQPLSEVHFSQGTSGTNSAIEKSTLRNLGYIASMILALAIVNYINLSTAQAIARAKEIGLRKIMGSGRSALITQFLAETFLLTTAAVVLACAIVQPLLQVFSNFVPHGVEFEISDTSTVTFLLCTIVITTIAAGIYPAWSLSRANAVQSIRVQHIPTLEERWGLRQALMVTQFSISTLFIIGTIIVRHQIQFMLHSDRGFDAEAVIEFSTDDRANMQRVKALQANIENIESVVGTARENMPPMGMDRAYTSIEYKPASAVPIQVAVMKSDEKLVPLYKIKLIAGRNLSPSDTLKEVLINESLSRVLGFMNPEDAVGQVIDIWNKKAPIAGVVADFHQADFHQSILPQVIMGIECADIAVRVKSSADLGGSIERISEEWRKVYPDKPFEYRIVDAELAKLYAKDQRMLWLTRVATGVAIFLSCIGLLGVTLYSIERRMREIGIRRVLGASVTQVVTLVSRDMVTLVMIAFIIACPLAWYATDEWLAEFAYRVTRSLWLYMAGGICTLAIALLTSGVLTVNAALVNPAKTLKSE